MRRKLTCDAGEQLSGEALDMTVGKGREIVTLEEVEDALTQQIGDDADVIPKVETIPEMDALVAVLGIVQGEGLQDAQLDARRVSVFLDRSNDLDGTFGPLALVVGLDDLAKRTLTKQTTDLICSPNQRIWMMVSVSPRPKVRWRRRRRRRPGGGRGEWTRRQDIQRSVKVELGTTM